MPQPPEAINLLTALCRMGRVELEEAYWRPRPAYDRGDTTAEEFWAAVLGETPGERLAALVAADVAGWLHPNVDSLAAVKRAAERGLRPAILSNAPREVGSAIDARTWLTPFCPRIFSYQLRAVKPDLAAFGATLERLGATPDEVVFLDDRPANVAAARQVGMRAEVFTDPAQFDSISS